MPKAFVCENCKKEFTTSKARAVARFCSKRCSGELRKYKIIFGTKSNQLTLIKESISEIQKSGAIIRRVECLCDCGNLVITRLTDFITGYIKSCGCVGKYPIEHNSDRNLPPYRHPLHGVWANMISRCYNPNNSEYHNYGGRGITVCSEWRNNYHAFLKWGKENGFKKGLKLDKDIAGKNIYSPETCQFVTDRVSLMHTRRNRHVYVDEVKYTLTEACEKFDIEISTAIYHLNKGRTFETIINRIKIQLNIKLTNEEVLFISQSNTSNAELALKYGVSKTTIQAIKTGRSLSNVTGISYVRKRKPYKQ